MDRDMRRFVQHYGMTAYDMIPVPTSPFEAIRRTDESGDYWMARELMPLLEYSTWQKFEEAIQRAKTDCAKAGRDVQEHFTPWQKTLRSQLADQARIIASRAMPVASSR
jgi:hypothetical protein